MNEFIELCALDQIVTGAQKHVKEGTAYIVVKGDDDVTVFSAVCPHQGGIVDACDGEIVCPLHGWRFGNDGTALNVKNANLFPVSSYLKDGKVFVGKASERIDNYLSSTSSLKNISVELLSHACAIVDFNGYRVLFDPWLDGPSFNGAWIHYPPNKIDVNALDFDAVVFTHEHSDHFHENTFKQFRRDVKIFIPDFPNQRMQTVLKTWQFSDVNVVSFGEPCILQENLRLTFYQPTGLWNDAILLLNSSYGNILNINDAGLNHDIASLLPKIDILFCQFNAGASGFPATWSNFDEEYKTNFYTNANKNKMTLLDQAAKLYKTQVLVPFASFFYLWHETHAQYAKLLSFNEPHAIREALSCEQYEVLDLLPGDRWSGTEGNITRKRTEIVAQKLYQPDTMLAYADSVRRKQTYKQFLFEDLSPSDEEVIRYFLSFNYVPAIVNCENFSFLFELVDPAYEVDRRFLIVFRDAQLTIEKIDKKVNAELEMMIPRGLAYRLVKYNESWDEVTIGYWCRFSRNPDVYHQGFWRLIQAAYFAEGFRENLDENGLSDYSLAKLLDDFPKVGPVLARYGLYCSYCEKRESETLGQALAYHGLSTLLRKALEADIAAVIAQERETCV